MRIQEKFGPQGPVDFLRLKDILNNTGLQTEKNSLYQFLSQFLEKANQSKNITNTFLERITGDITINENNNLPGLLALILNIISQLQGASFWTENDDTLFFPDSNQVLAGTGITLDYSVPGKVTISASGGGGGVCYIPLSQGIEPLTFMSDGLGQPMLIPFIP